MQETLASKAELQRDDTGGGEAPQRTVSAPGPCRCRQALARVEGVASRLRTVEEMWASELADVRQEVEACVSGGRAAVRMPPLQRRAGAADSAARTQWNLIRQVRAEESAHQRAMQGAEAKKGLVEAECGAMRARVEALEGTAAELGRQVAALKARLDRARERSARDARRVQELEQENQGGWRSLPRLLPTLSPQAPRPLTPRALAPKSCAVARTRSAGPAPQPPPQCAASCRLRPEVSPGIPHRVCFGTAPVVLAYRPCYSRAAHTEATNLHRP